MIHKKRILGGGIWLTVHQLSDKIIKLIYFTLIFRFLGADKAGLFGLMLTIVLITNGALSTGLRKTFVRNYSNDHPVLSALFIIEVLRGIIVYMLLLLCSPLLEWIFNVSFGSYFNVLALYIPILGLYNIQVLRYEKSLFFKKLFVIRIWGRITEASIGVAGILYYQSIWAPVLGIVAGATVDILLSYISMRAPSFKIIDIRRTLLLFNHAKWFSLNQLLFYPTLYLDDLFMAQLAGVEKLAIYQLIFKYATNFFSEFSAVISSLLFPVYAGLKNEMNKLHNMLRESSTNMLLIIFPLLVFFISTSRNLVFLICNTRTDEVVIAFYLLALSGFLRAYLSAFSEYFVVTNDMRRSTLMLISRIVIICSCSIPAYRYIGFPGIALTVLIGVVAGYYFLFTSDLRTQSTFKFSDLFPKHSIGYLLIPIIAIPFSAQLFTSALGSLFSAGITTCVCIPLLLILSDRGNIIDLKRIFLIK